MAKITVSDNEAGTTNYRRFGRGASFDPFLALNISVFFSEICSLNASSKTFDRVNWRASAKIQKPESGCIID